MKKIIFLDIDGVLNSTKTFKENRGYEKAYNTLIKQCNDSSKLKFLRDEQLLSIDMNKVYLIKEITELTAAKIVISSSWRIHNLYPLIEEFLINQGLPIIGTTKRMSGRGEEISSYVRENNIKNYIIIDDSIFPDFTEEQKYNLVWTNFYDEGLTEECVNEAVLKLGLKNN